MFEAWNALKMLNIMATSSVSKSVSMQVSKLGALENFRKTFVVWNALEMLNILVTSLSSKLVIKWVALENFWEDL